MGIGDFIEDTVDAVKDTAERVSNWVFFEHPSLGITVASVGLLGVTTLGIVGACNYAAKIEKAKLTEQVTTQCEGVLKTADADTLQPCVEYGLEQYGELRPELRAQYGERKTRMVYNAATKSSQPSTYTDYKKADKLTLDSTNVRIAEKFQSK